MLLLGEAGCDVRDRLADGVIGFAEALAALVRDPHLDDAAVMGRAAQVSASETANAVVFVLI